MKLGLSAAAVIAGGLVLAPKVSLAACSDPLVVKDGNSASVNMSVKTGADGNCQSQFDTDTSANLYTAITAPPTAGSTTGGLSAAIATGLSTTVVSVDASAGQLYEVYCYNPNTSVAFLQIFNSTAAGVTLGATAPTLSYGIPASQAAGFAHSIVGVQFSNAISVASANAPSVSTANTTAISCNFIFK